MLATQDVSPQLSTPTPSIDLDVIDVLLPLVEFKYVILLVTFVGLLLAATIALLTHSVYTAAAVILPPQQSQSSAGLISQLGGLASLSGLGGASARDPNDLYIALLQSETVGDAVIHRLGLKSAYKMPSDAYARLVLGANSKFFSSRGGLLTIAVTDRDPKRAATIANAYVEELHNMNDKLAISEAARRAFFFGQELKLQKDRLADAEAALQQTEQTTGTIAPGNQTALVIQQIAELQAQLRSREVELQSLRLSSTDQNPDVIHVNQEMAVLRSQLAALENGQKSHIPGDVLLTSQSLPGAQLTYGRKLRDVSYQTYLVELIARQFEAAKLDEAKAAPVIQLVDAARPPEWKSGPYRTLWAVGGAVFSFFLACVVVIGHYLYRCLLSDNTLVRRLEPVKRALRSGF